METILDVKSAIDRYQTPNAPKSKLLHKDTGNITINCLNRY